MNGLNPNRFLHRLSNSLDTVINRISLTSFLLIFALLLSFSWSQPAFAKKANKDKVKFKVLQNKQLDECIYMEDVVIRVKYRLRSMDYGTLSAQISQDGQNYFEVSRVDIEKGKGKVIMELDAGSCATDLKVVIQ